LRAARIIATVLMFITPTFFLGHLAPDSKMQSSTKEREVKN
jgi:hypothetical protein